MDKLFLTARISCEVFLKPGRDYIHFLYKNLGVSVSDIDNSIQEECRIISHKALRESDLFCISHTVKIFYMSHKKACRRIKKQYQYLHSLTGAGSSISIL